MQTKKLLIVIPTLIGGGMERVASELANYYSDKSELSVSILMYGNNVGTNYALSDAVEIITNKRKFNYKFRVFSTVNALFFLRSTVKAVNPDYVLSFGEFWNNFVMLALIGRTKNVFLSDRCQPDKSLGKLHDNLRKFLYPKAKGLIVQTEYAYKLYSQYNLNKNIYCVPNPIRIPKINELNSIENRKNIILSVGRLIKSKNFDLLIKYFSEIDNDNWKLVIVGDNINDPEMLKKLKETAIKFKVNHKVELVGHRSDVEEFYKSSKIFAFTSSSEGFPNVLIEALSYGLPLVSFDCHSGPGEIIQNDHNGFLIPLFDEYRFKAALSNLMKNNSLLCHMSKNAYNSAKRYSIDNVSQTISNIFKNQNEE